MTRRERLALGFTLAEALHSCGSISQRMIVLDLYHDIGKLINDEAQRRGKSGFIQHSEFVASFNSTLDMLEPIGDIPRSSSIH